MDHSTPSPIIHFDEIDSTNSYILRQSSRAHCEDLSGAWIIAEKQTQGKGRRGRIWESQTGNLMASYAMTTDWSPSAIAQLGFVISLSTCFALKTILPKRYTAKLKWPNDVWVNDAKISGNLIESSAGRSPMKCVAIGVGVNIKWAPVIQDKPTCCLQDFIAREIDPIDLLAQIDVHWRRFLEQIHEFRSSFGDVRTDGDWFAPLIRPLWMAEALHLGQICEIQTTDGIRKGRFVDVGDDGSLILEDNSGEHHIFYAGDVSFVPTAQD